MHCAGVLHKRRVDFSPESSLKFENMKLLLVCLIAVCATAAPPPAPMIPATFVAEGEIEFHGAEKTEFGKFTLARDQVKMMGLEAAHYEDPKETEAALLRYDMTPNHMAYYIRGAMGGEHCAIEKRNVTSKLEPFFDWVKYATYEGEQKIREQFYDFWGLSIADVRFELAVHKSAPNTPAYFNRKEAEDFVHYNFASFMVQTPDPSMFEVPKACMDS